MDLAFWPTLVDQVVAVPAYLRLQLCSALEHSSNSAKTKLKRVRKLQFKSQLSPQMRVRSKSKAIAGRRNTSWQNHRKSTKRPKMKSKRKELKLKGWWKKKKIRSCKVCKKWRLLFDCRLNFQAKTQSGCKKGSGVTNFRPMRLKNTWSGSTNSSSWNSRRFWRVFTKALWLKCIKRPWKRRFSVKLVQAVWAGTKKFTMGFLAAADWWTPLSSGTSMSKWRTSKSHLTCLWSCSTTILLSNQRAIRSRSESILTGRPNTGSLLAMVCGLIGVTSPLTTVSLRCMKSLEICTDSGIWRACLGCTTTTWRRKQCKVPWITRRPKNTRSSMPKIIVTRLACALQQPKSLGPSRKTKNRWLSN